MEQADRAHAGADLVQENHAQDDGVPWGFIERGEWVELPKLTMLRAGLGPPPFAVRLPMGELRQIVHPPPQGAGAGDCRG